MTIFGGPVNITRQRMNLCKEDRVSHFPESDLCETTLFAHVLLPKQWPFPGDDASVRGPGTRAEVKNQLPLILHGLSW